MTHMYISPILKASERAGISRGMSSGWSKCQMSRVICGLILDSIQGFLLRNAVTKKADPVSMIVTAPLGKSGP